MTSGIPATGEPGRGSPRFVDGPLIGREAEVRAFEELLERVSRGHASVAVLTGETGIGRTRLLQELAAIASRQRAGVLVPEQPGAGDAPLAGFRNARAEGRLQAVRQAMACPGNDHDHFGHVMRTVAEAARTGPVWIMIDDLHAADEATGVLVERLLAAIQHGALRQCSVGLVLSALAGQVPKTFTGRSARRAAANAPLVLDLQPFDEREVTQWLASRFGVEPECDLVAQLYRASSGNPLMLTELADHLRRSGLLSEANGILAGTVDPNALTLPCDLISLLESKAEAISGECRRAMTLAAFLGHEFAADTLAELMARAVADLEGVLAEALGAALIDRRGDGRWAFRHSSAREFFYATPDQRRRQAAHLEISERLIEEFGEAADEHCLTITHHLVRGGADADPEKVLRFASGAARSAFEHQSYYLAGRYFEAAAEAGAGTLVPQACADLHCSAGEAFQRWSDGKRSVPCFERAVRLYEQSGDRLGAARALQGLLRTHIKFGEPARETTAVANRLEALLSGLPKDAHELRVRVNDTLASYYCALGQFHVAEAYAQTAMDIARNAPGDPSLRCIPVTSLALAQMEQLRLTDAKTTWLEGLSYDRAAGASRYEGLHLQRLPAPLYGMGEVQEAAYYNQSSYRHNQAIGNTGQLCLNYTVEVMIANLCGSFDVAASTGYRCLDLLADTNYLWSAPSLVAALSYALIMRERFDEAERVIDHLVTPKVLFEDPSPYHSMAARLMALLASQRTDGVRRDFPLAPEDHRRNLRGVRIGNVGMLCCEVELALFERQPERLNGIHDALDMVYKRGVFLSVDWCFSVPRSLGVSAALRGDVQRARGYFEDADKLAARCNAPLEGARVQLYRALVMLALEEPDPAPARQHLEAALATFEQYQAPVLAHLARQAQRDLLRGTTP